jgi:hypothetical protein
VSVVGVEIDPTDNHLIFMLSNNTYLDAGEFPIKEIRDIIYVSGGGSSSDTTPTEPPTETFYILQENGDRLILEDDSGFGLTEDAP